MTIVAGAACPEGLVVAGDSRTTVMLQTPGSRGASRRSATDYARKVNALDGKHLVATWGWAHLEGQTISGVIQQFDDQTTVDDDVNVAAEQVRDFFQTRMQAHVSAGWDPSPNPGQEPLGLMIAGYEPAGIGRLKRIGPFWGAIQNMFETNRPGGMWNGEVDVMVRLVKGYDAARVNTSKWAARHQKTLAGLEYLTNFGWFALQDAIDWAMYAVRTTIDTQRFTNGTVGSPGATPTCGGQVEVAAVTSAGVRWIKQTDLRA